MSQPDELMLEKYAELTVHVGLNLHPGQRLLVRAPVETAPFVRLVVASAYKAGARYVDVQWSDDLVSKARYQYAPRDSFEEYPVYLADGRQEYARSGDASLAIYAEDPDLLKDADQELVAIAVKTNQNHNKPFMDMLVRNQFNWSLVSIPIPSWAAKVFPDLPAEERLASLWKVIFKVCRVDLEDPVEAWRQHLSELSARCEALNRQRFTNLHYTGPGTDLTIGLPDGHRWLSGSSTSAGGITYVANMPTEEVFTLPHKDRLDGFVSSTLPLSYAGTLIEDFQLTFEEGRVVNFQAARGETALAKLLETDEGARRLGEVALVPHSSPVAQSGVLFYNTLFDENASSHLALGKAYQDSLDGGKSMSDDDFAAAGGNESLTHVDFMVGSDQLDIDGILADGARLPVMRGGEWAFEA